MSTFWHIPPADQPVARWSVSPAVDLAAYAFSWVWILVPLLFFGPDRKEDYLYLYMAAIVLIDIHRHYGLPYVYMDRQVTARFPLRFVLFPTAMFVGFAVTPYMKHWTLRADFEAIGAIVAGVLVFFQILRRDQNDKPIPWKHLGWALVPGCVLAGLLSVWMSHAAGLLWLVAFWVASLVLDWCMWRDHDEGEGLFKPTFINPLLITVLALAAIFFGQTISQNMPKGGLSTRNIISAIVVFAVGWNIWHVYMQKYGIMRMYNAKSGNKDKVPGWVDRLLVLGWLPLYMAWLGPRYGDLIRENFKKGTGVVEPMLKFFTMAQPVLLPLGIALVIFAVGAFIHHERRANGLRNAPRLFMGIGTTLLSATFLFVDPIKAYIAYGVSHAIEYMVFVWAYQRRRYQAPLSHKPVLGQILRHPLVAYLGFTLVLALAFFYLKYYGKYIFTDEQRPRFLDFKTTTWFFYWTVYQSMVHFYFDGFLWKMRLPATRAHI